MNHEEQEFHELVGALDAIHTLREELELQLEEARDDCMREVLDNIIMLVNAQDVEYRHRRDELGAHMQQKKTEHAEP